MATVKGALTAGGPEIKRAHAKLKGKDKNDGQDLHMISLYKARRSRALRTMSRAGPRGEPARTRLREWGREFTWEPQGEPCLDQYRTRVPRRPYAR